jgi:SAM-dependent methyltransferase
MLAVMKAKAGSDRVAITVGDFAAVDVPGEFAVVALLTNTIYALPDQAAQVRCFANAARHLAPGGRFIVEAWLPRPPAEPGPTLEPRRLAPGHIGLVVAEHDPIRQIMTTTQIVLGGSAGVRVFPVVHRYAYPAELDLMAQLANLQLEQRWADWQRSPLVAASTDHISIYRKV